MSEIKKGDWMLYRNRDIVRVFQYCGFSETYPIEKQGESRISHHPSSCTPLRPYASIDEVKVGDRCVIVGNIDDWAGSVGTVVSLPDYLPFDVIMKVEPIKMPGEIRQNNFKYKRLAPLPDVAKNIKMPEPEWDRFGMAEIKEPNPLPLPCPHPEWEGVWDYQGDGYRVEWVSYHFQARAIRDDMRGVIHNHWQPGELWTQIESEPGNTPNGPILPRPKMTRRVDRINTPCWDPYGEG